MCVCLQELTSVSVCARVVKLRTQLPKRPNWSRRESSHESGFSNFYILLAETYMLWQWRVTGHVTGTAVNSQTAELWRWPPVCSCNYCTRCLIHKPITHLHPSPRGRYNLFHFIADLWIYACLYNRCLMYTIYCMCTCNSILIICSFQREIKRCFGVMVRTLQNCLAKIVHFCMYVYVTSW